MPSLSYESENLINESIQELRAFLDFRHGKVKFPDCEKKLVYSISLVFKEILKSGELNSLVGKNSGLPWKQIADLYDALYNNLPEFQQIGGRDVPVTLYYDENFRDEALRRISGQDLEELILSLESIKDFPHIFRQKMPIANHIRKVADFHNDEKHLQIIKVALQALLDADALKKLGSIEINNEYYLRFIVAIGESFPKLSDFIQDKIGFGPLMAKFTEARHNLCHAERGDSSEVINKISSIELKSNANETVRLILNYNSNIKLDKIISQIHEVQGNVYGYKASGPESQIGVYNTQTRYSRPTSNDTARRLYRSDRIYLAYKGEPENELSSRNTLGLYEVPVGKAEFRLHNSQGKDGILKVKTSRPEHILRPVKSHKEQFTAKFLEGGQNIGLSKTDHYFCVSQSINHILNLRIGAFTIPKSQDLHSKLLISVLKEVESIDLLATIVQININDYLTEIGKSKASRDLSFIKIFSAACEQYSYKCSRLKNMDKKLKYVKYIEILKPLRENNHYYYGKKHNQCNFNKFVKDYDYIKRGLEKIKDKESEAYGDMNSNGSNHPNLNDTTSFQNKLNSLEEFLRKGCDQVRLLKQKIERISSTTKGEKAKSSLIKNMKLAIDPIRELYQIQAGSMARFILENPNFAQHLDDDTKSLLYAFLQVQRGSLAHNHINTAEHVKLKKVIDHHIEKISEQKRIFCTALEATLPGMLGQVYLDNSLIYLAAIKYAKESLISKDFFCEMRTIIIEQERKEILTAKKNIRTYWKAYIEKQRSNKVENQLQNLSLNS